MSEKLDTALSYLYGLKPWWSTLYEKMKRVDYEYEPVMSIENGELVYNTQYVFDNDVKTIAATLDFLGQKYIRSLEERLHHQLGDPAKRDLANVAIALEVNDDLGNSYRALDENIRQSRLRVASLLDPQIISERGLDEPPMLSILDDSLTPASFGLESGLSAESYFAALYDKEKELESQQLEYDIAEAAAESEGDPTEDDDSGDSSTGSDSGSDSSEGEFSEDGSSKSSDGMSSGDDSQEESESDNQDGAEPEESGNSQEEGESSDGGAADGQSGSGGSSENESPGGSGNGETSPESRSEAGGSSDRQSAEDGDSGPQGADRGSERPTTVRDRITELLNDSPIAQWQCEGAHNTQESQPEVKENIAKIAKDIERLAGRPGLEGMVTPSMEVWAAKHLPKRRKNWANVLRKAVSTSVSGAAMSGQADMSYARRNMNQSDEPGSPIMMGLVTYPPNAMILVDSSPSMRAYKDSVLPEFVNIVKKVTISRGAPCDVVAADAEISWAARGLSKTRGDLSHIFNGKRGTTDLADVLLTIASKGVRWNNLNIARPDIIVMLTDCKFDWPMPKHTRLPGRYARVVVASTETYDHLIELGYTLPKWLVPGKNFVYIDE